MRKKAAWIFPYKIRNLVLELEFCIINCNLDIAMSILDGSLDAPSKMNIGANFCTEKLFHWKRQQINLVKYQLNFLCGGWEA